MGELKIGFLVESAFKIAGAVAIGFFFIIIVMIATAQQDVVTRMKAEGLSVGYSSALGLRDQVRRKADAAAKLVPAEQSISTQLNRVRRYEQAAEARFGQEWEVFEPDLARLQHLHLCDLSFPASDTTESRVKLAGQVGQCELDGGSPLSATKALTAAQQEARQVIELGAAQSDAGQRVDSFTTQLAVIDKQIVDGRTPTDDEAKATRSFGDMDVLLQPWVLFGNFLVQFPPPLLQILLTFMSGLFGALLVTLILIVYPSNLVETASAARPVTRTFLGGFIALCVYIVLLSGTAVLGTGNSGNGAGTNYMAFCGIGILAGMYSDRVAGWLSKRADEFFKQ